MSVFETDDVPFFLTLTDRMTCSSGDQKSGKSLFFLEPEAKESFSRKAISL